VDLVKQGKFGYAAGLRGTEIVPVKLKDAVEQLKMVKEDLFELTRFFSTVQM